jgi:hypothetical protein
LVIAAWQAWRAKDIESEFSEAKYIGLSIFSMCQAFLTGIPIVAVVKDIPEAFYLVTVFLIFILCAVLLSLIFLPKIIIQTKYSKLSSSEQRRMLTSSVRKSAYLSSSRNNRPSSEFSSGISGLELPANAGHASGPLQGSGHMAGSAHFNKTKRRYSDSVVKSEATRRMSEAKERRLSASIQGFLLTGSGLQMPSSNSGSSSDVFAGGNDTERHVLGEKGAIIEECSSDTNGVIPEETSVFSNKSSEIVFGAMSEVENDEAGEVIENTHQEEIRTKCETKYDSEVTVNA